MNHITWRSLLAREHELETNQGQALFKPAIQFCIIAATYLSMWSKQRGTYQQLQSLDISVYREMHQEIKKYSFSTSCRMGHSQYDLKEILHCIIPWTTMTSSFSPALGRTVEHFKTPFLEYSSMRAFHNRLRVCVYLLWLYLLTISYPYT